MNKRVTLSAAAAVDASLVTSLSVQEAVPSLEAVISAQIGPSNEEL